MSGECMEKAKPGDRVHRINVLAEAEDDAPICWVCLDHATPDKPLMHPCKCPSWCHSSCIARWQLQSAGTRREKYCDFCSSELPDWKSVLTPVPGASAPAVMNVNFDNKTYSFQVAPGADGYRQFTEAIRKAFHLPDDSELNITFTCDEPSSGSLLTLSGPGAYDAAVHCASVSAARRSMSGDSSSSGSSSGASSPSHLQQQQLQSLGFSRSLSFEGPADAHDGLDQYPRSQVDPAAAAAGRGVEGSSHMMHRRTGGSSSSNPDFQDFIINRTTSSSSSNESGSSIAAGRTSYSPVSSTGEQRPSAAADPTTAAAEDTAAAAAATHYDPAASPPVSEMGEPTTPGRTSESGSECSSEDSPAAAAHGDCCRPLSSASTSSAASSSGGSSSSGRRGSGLGKKLRDAISELLISK